jgi:hypothetical protein
MRPAAAVRAREVAFARSVWPDQHIDRAQLDFDVGEGSIPADVDLLELVFTEQSGDFLRVRSALYSARALSALARVAASDRALSTT